MTWDNHIIENCRKAMNRLTALKRLGNKIPQSSKLTIYLSFIRLVLEYGHQLYDNCINELSEKLEHVQREALLFVSGAYKKNSHRELLKQVGVPNLQSRRQAQKIQLMYKVYHDLLPDYLQQIIPQKVGDGSNYALWNTMNFKIPKCKIIF